MTRFLIALLLGLSCSLIATKSLSVTPAEQLADPALEQRARDVSKHLRCVVCQNQSIDDSNAPLAADMRRLVRERITAGDSNEQVTQFMVDRYGNFVLLKPPVNKNTLALWVGPFGFLIIGGFIFWITSRRKKTEATPATNTSDPDEEKRLDALLKQIRK
jgi:cytochrome c-type biogenesis protein CcmH